MGNFELWAKHKDKTYYEKIEEFEDKWQTYSKIDQLLETGDYIEATVLQDHKYIYGKKYKKSKTKRL